MASDSARREDHFQKRNFSKTDLPFRFCKIGLRNTLFIFGRKCSFVMLFCFVAALPDFGLLFFKIEALIELRKMRIRKKLFYLRFGNCSTVKYPDSADLLDLQRCN